jgi:hypothetical protein
MEDEERVPLIATVASQTGPRFVEPLPSALDRDAVEDTEARTVEAIAAWLEQVRPGLFYGGTLARQIRSGAWRKS